MKSTVRGAAFALAMTAGIVISSTGHAADSTLYNDLGGEKNIQAFTNELFDLVLQDDRIKDQFDNINIDRLKTRVAKQFCVVVGGPCVYKGKDMKTAHKGLKLKNMDFNALVEDLQVAMDHAKVPFFTQNRLLALLAPMQRDVVTR